MGRLRKPVVTPDPKNIRRCSACGIVENGELCNEVLTEYRGRLICSSCYNAWRAMEKEEEVKFLEFKWRGQEIPNAARASS